MREIERPLLCSGWVGTGRPFLTLGLCRLHAHLTSTGHAALLGAPVSFAAPGATVPALPGFPTGIIQELSS